MIKLDEFLSRIREAGEQAKKEGEIIKRIYANILGIDPSEATVERLVKDLEEMSRELKEDKIDFTASPENTDDLGDCQIFLSRHTF